MEEVQESEELVEERQRGHAIGAEREGEDEDAMESCGYRQRYSNVRSGLGIESEPPGQG